MRYGVAGFGCLCAMLWVLLGFGVLEGHVSSVARERGEYCGYRRPTKCADVHIVRVGISLPVCDSVCATR